MDKIGGIMGSLAWSLIGLEVILAIWVVRLVWRVEAERPTESIVPKTDADAELVA